MSKLWIFILIKLVSLVQMDVIYFEKEDQPPWYHPAWPDTHPSQMNTSQLMVYLMENPVRNRPRVSPAAQRGRGGPDKVHIDMIIFGIPAVNVDEQSMKLVLNVRASWVDWRLDYSRFNRSEEHLLFHYEDVTSSGSVDPITGKIMFAKLWRPDVSFVNEIGSMRIENTEPNVLMRVYPNGTVIFSEKLVIKTQCHLLLHRFPLDTQTCPLYLGSSNHPSSELTFQWNSNIRKPVLVSRWVTLPEFTVTRVEWNNSCHFNNFIPKIANFTCLEVLIHLKRLFIYYFIEIYVPSVIVVAISWINFWIDIEAVTARVSLGMLTVLTIATQRSGIASRIPRVAYEKAVDVWMTFCLFMVVFAMLEYSVVNCITHRPQAGQGGHTLSRFSVLDKDESAPKNQERTRQRSSISPAQLQQLATCARLRYRIRRSFRRFRTNPGYAVDVLSRITFPLVFIVFNCVYWVFYLYIFTENPQHTVES